MYVPRAMYSLSTSFCTVPRELRARHALLLADHHVHREQDRRGRVDRHRGGDAVERDAAEEIAPGRPPCRSPRRPARPRLAPSAWSESYPIWVGRSNAVERPVCPAVEQAAEAAVGLLGRAESGVLAHGPEPAGVHRGMDAAREGELAGRAEIASRDRRPSPPGRRPSSQRRLDGRAARAGCRRAASVSATNPTSSREPITSGVRWCRASA